MPENKELKSLPPDEVLRGLGKGEHGEIWAKWSFPEVPQYQRSRGWWIIMSLIGLAVVIWSLVKGNFLFAVIIIIVALIIVFQAKRETLKVDFEINQDGIKVGSTFYEWSQIKQFWIIYKPPEVKKLYLALKSILPPILSVPMQKQNPVEIRRILLRYALEDLSKEEESFSDFLGRSLKI